MCLCVCSLFNIYIYLLLSLSLLLLLQWTLNCPHCESGKLPKAKMSVRGILFNWEETAIYTAWDEIVLNKKLLMEDNDYEECPTCNQVKKRRGLLNLIDRKRFDIPSILKDERVKECSTYQIKNSDHTLECKHEICGFCKKKLEGSSSDNICVFATCVKTLNDECFRNALKIYFTCKKCDGEKIFSPTTTETTETCVHFNNVTDLIKNNIKTYNPFDFDCKLFTTAIDGNNKINPEFLSPLEGVVLDQFKKYLQVAASILKVSPFEPKRYKKILPNYFYP